MTVYICIYYILSVTYYCDAFALRVCILVYPTTLILFHSTRGLLWRFNVAGIHAKRPIFLRHFNLIRIFSTDFHKSPQYKNLRKSVHRQTRMDWRTDGHDEVNRYFRKYVKEPNKIVNVWKVQGIFISSYFTIIIWSTGSSSFKISFVYLFRSILNKFHPQQLDLVKCRIFRFRLTVRI